MSPFRVPVLSRATYLAAGLAYSLGACDTERSAWNRAASTNTAAAYERFLAEHPGGELADSATTRLHEAAWAGAEADGTRDAYLAFLRKYPTSRRGAAARSRSALFRVGVAGRGAADEPAADPLRAGPIVSIAPQWDSLNAPLDGTTIFATTAGGDTIPLEFFAPVDLGRSAARIAPRSPAADGKFTSTRVIPRINTFNHAYELLAADAGRIVVTIEFTTDRQPIRMGLLFGRDLAQLDSIHVLGTSLPASAFGRAFGP